MERYHESNAPLIYQLQKELNNIRQDSMSIAMYYSKLRRIWDELQALEGIPVCTCGVMSKCACAILKKMVEKEATTKLMQFLMGLTDTYDHVRSSILSLDPLPSVNKAFHMVLQIERQKEITGQYVQSHDALAAGKQYSQNAKNGNSSNTGSNGRDSKKAKMDRKCEYCN